MKGGGIGSPPFLRVKISQIGRFLFFRNMKFLKRRAVSFHARRLGFLAYAVCFLQYNFAKTVYRLQILKFFDIMIIF